MTRTHHVKPSRANIMSSPAIGKQKKSAVKPRQKMHLEGEIQPVNGIIELPNMTRQIITCSMGSSSLRVWDLESGMHVGEWKDEGSNKGVLSMALSPDGKTVACGCEDGIVRLWDISRSRVIKTWTEHTAADHHYAVISISWSPNGGKVVCGNMDGMFRVWNVKSGKIILGPIEIGEYVYGVRYSTDGKMISTGGNMLRVWDANTGEQLKTLEFGIVADMAWTSDGSTLITGSRRFDTSTWTEINGEWLAGSSMDTILSPNERILASVPTADKHTVQLWNLENHQCIGPPLHHEDEDEVSSAVFAADGNLFVTGCDSGCVYAWDVSAIAIEAGLDGLLTAAKAVKPFVDVNITGRRAPKIEGVRRIPPGFFDDHVNSSTSRGHRTAAPLRPSRSSSHNILSLAQNFLSSMLRRRDGSAIRLPPVVEVPLTAGKPVHLFLYKFFNTNTF
ncbi:WD40-repeat-containing domain protein [Suillus discolor]|uniref:WD40-repeat-containing domain protein n=1 Tax=Suillus discolor TaxID=1912936 RepID=A0A9P7FDG7_9AGAM|nr:WD40-repeat-containing domain protein [Suillus discolor]KAG2112690.1 WD40-repeat-containing domain protein [Suillus discolor]